MESSVEGQNKVMTTLRRQCKLPSVAQVLVKHYLEFPPIKGKLTG